MNSKKTITAVAVMALSATLAFAGDHGAKGRGHHGRGGVESKMAAKLNLTDLQKQQIKEIRTASREANKAFFENARQMRKDVRDAREANDTAKLESLKSSMTAQREQMKQIREAEMQKILALLTPDQRTQFEALKADHKGRGKGHKSRG